MLGVYTICFLATLDTSEETKTFPRMSRIIPTALSTNADELPALSNIIKFCTK